MTPPRCSQCPRWIPRASYTAGLVLCASCEEQAWDLWGRHLMQEDERFLSLPLVNFRLIKRWFMRGAA